jgi:N-acetylmuramoyl-L-alanine amidase
MTRLLNQRTVFKNVYRNTLLAVVATLYGSWSCIPPVASLDWTGDSEEVVVLDPGHGGKDPGASGALVKEKNLTLKLSLKVKKLLNENLPKIKVYLTRSTDEFIGLQERAAFANAKKADLFVSVHFNANKNKTIAGTETYALGLHKADDNFDIMKRENSTILLEEDYKAKYDDFDPASAESYIIFKLQQHAFLKQSLSLADLMENEFVKTGKRTSRGTKQAGFMVLWQTSMPSVLVEGGFVSNPAEEKFLATDAGIDLLAKSMFNAIKAYRSRQEGL